MSELSSQMPSLASASSGPRRRSMVAERRWLTTDAVMAGLARLGAVSILFMLAALIVVLTVTAWPSITEYGAKFLVSSEWRPNELEVPVKDAAGHNVFEDGEMLTKTLPPTFGALPVIYGTVVSSILALVFAVPLSFGAALFLVRLCPRMLVGTISFLVEFLAAIPSIAYGMWGLFVLAPFLQRYIEPALRSALSWIPGVNSWLFVHTVERGGQAITSDVALTGRDMFCGGLVLAIMILPIITAVSRDVLRSVPRAKSRARWPWARRGGKAPSRCSASAARPFSAR